MVRICIKRNKRKAIILNKDLLLNVSTSCLGTFGVLIFYLCCKERVLGHMVRILVEPSPMGQRLYVFVVCFILVIIF